VIVIDVVTSALRYWTFIDKVPELEGRSAGESARRVKCILEVVMTHIPVAGVPPHTLDASFSEVLARVIELAGILAIRHSMSQLSTKGMCCHCGGTSEYILGQHE
jgi:hypothetical protein